MHVDQLCPYVVIHWLFLQNEQRRIDPNLWFSKVLEFLLLMLKQLHWIYRMKQLEQIAVSVEQDF
jgi:hypothetical protein